MNPDREETRKRLSCWSVDVRPDVFRSELPGAAVSVYLNDIACGVLMKFEASGPGPDRAARETRDAVAGLLRTVADCLRRIDVVRPVVGVYCLLGEGAENGKERREEIRDLEGDDSMNRGDFALRRAEDEADAERLLSILMANSPPALDLDAVTSRTSLEVLRDKFGNPPAEIAGNGLRGRLWRRIRERWPAASGSDPEPVSPPLERRNFMADELRAWIEAEEKRLA